MALIVFTLFATLSHLLNIKAKFILVLGPDVYSSSCVPSLTAEPGPLLCSFLCISDARPFCPASRMGGALLPNSLHHGEPHGLDAMRLWAWAEHPHSRLYSRRAWWHLLWVVCLFLQGMSSFFQPLPLLPHSVSPATPGFPSCLSSPNARQCRLSLPSSRAQGRGVTPPAPSHTFGLVGCCCHSSHERTFPHQSGPVPLQAARALGRRSSAFGGRRLGDLARPARPSSQWETKKGR